MKTTNENNLKKLAKTTLLTNFVKKNDAKWNHQQWTDLLGQLEAKGYNPIDPDQVGLLLEAKKEAYLSKKLCASN